MNTMRSRSDMNTRSVHHSYNNSLSSNRNNLESKGVQVGKPHFLRLQEKQASKDRLKFNNTRDKIDQNTMKGFRHLTLYSRNNPGITKSNIFKEIIKF